MSTLHRLSREGDKSVSWDPQKVHIDHLDPQKVHFDDSVVAEAIKEAEKIFEEVRKGTNTAFEVDAETGRTLRRIDTFDPTVEERIVIVPRVVGG